MKMLLSLPLLLLLCSKSAIGAEVKIFNPTDFYAFLDGVNNGTYSRTTVLLYSDLFLSEITESIGDNSDNSFCGVFDGQGHIISNLTINSSSNYTGLFGYSTGLTIRNVVLDSSCSITSSYNDPNSVYVGGIIGYCKSYSGQCNIENSVNLADVSFSGTTAEISLSLGGIAGRIESKAYDDYVKNCANYGSVAYSGTNTNVFIGGIVGYVGNSKYTYLYNCLNRGTVKYSGSISNFLCISGISGYNSYAYIENCVSAGDISILAATSYSNYIGSILGYVLSSTSVKHSFWMDSIAYRACAGGNPTIDYETSKITPNSQISEKLNNYSASNGWNRWTSNKNENMVTFNVDKTDKFFINSNVVLIPDFVDGDGHSFSGWYSDVTLTTPFVSNDVSSNIVLYSVFCDSGYTVKLELNGGDTSSLSPHHMKAIVCDDVYKGLFTPTKEGATFNGWYTEDGSMVGTESKVTNTKDHTLYAQWTNKIYSLIFVFDNGNEPDERAIEYGAGVVYPEDPVKEGYTFNGWDISIVVMPAYDVTITAQWVSNSDKNGVNGGVIAAIVISVVIVILAIAAAVVYYYMRENGYELADILGFCCCSCSSNDNDSGNSGDSKGFFDLNNPLIGGSSSSSSKSSSSSPKCKRCRAVTLTMDEVESRVATVNAQSALSILYLEERTTPIMRNALSKANLNRKQVDMVCNASERAATRALESGTLFAGFTEDDAAAIAMYTYDFGHKSTEQNPHRIINKSLVMRNHAEMQRVGGLIYLVINAVRKLPKVTGVTLYRGVKGEVSLDDEHYCLDNIVTWPAMSSVSTDMESVKKSLEKSSRSRRVSKNNTLFIIEDGWGYDIQPYSVYPNEPEIVLEPERQFKVVSVTRKIRVTTIRLQMLDTPCRFHIYLDK